MWGWASGLNPKPQSKVKPQILISGKAQIPNPNVGLAPNP